MTTAEGLYSHHERKNRLRYAHTRVQDLVERIWPVPGATRMPLERALETEDSNLLCLPPDQGI